MDGPELIDLGEQQKDTPPVFDSKPNFEEKPSKKVFIFGSDAQQKTHSTPTAPAMTPASTHTVSLTSVKTENPQFLNLNNVKPISIIDKGEFILHQTPVGDIKVRKMTSGGAENKPQSKFCFNAIVKNEESCIIRRLKNLLPLMDAMCITDTGSTDKTMELIREFGKEHNILTNINESPFKNFEDARTVALNNAEEFLKNHPSPGGWYLMFGDADDLNFGGNFKKVQQLQEKHRPLSPKFDRNSFDADVYQVDMVSGNTKYPYTWMVKLKEDRKYDWKTPIHEYLRIKEWKNKESPAVYKKIKGLYVESRREGFRSKDPEKYLRDALTFIQALKKPDADIPRCQFYLAQSFRDAGMYKESYENYQLRYNMGGFPGELYCSLMNMFIIKSTKLKKDHELHDIAFKAINIDPNRLEVPYHYMLYLSKKPMFDTPDETKINTLLHEKSVLISNLENLKKDPKFKIQNVNPRNNWDYTRPMYKAAWAFAKSFLDVKVGENILFMDIMIHDHLFYFEASELALKTGHKEEGVNLLKKCLQSFYLSDEKRKNIKAFFEKEKITYEEVVKTEEDDDW